MKQHLSPIIQPDELLNLRGYEGLVIIDASNGTNARENYKKKHLDGALYVDLNTQLADIKDDASKGGRHPLPEIHAFAETLKSLGISPESHVVIYDDKNASNAAARFWWMLRSAGHTKVQVLDGGMQAAEKAGYPVNSKTEIPTPAKIYQVTRWQLPLADISEIEKLSQDKNGLVIDVRSSERYRGETEPIDLVAGHIPGAVNVPFTTNMNEAGTFLSPKELRKKYQELFHSKTAEKIAVHCGSGVTACHTLLAIAYAGLAIPKLYVGSWSEWSRNDKPVAKKEN